jgi:amino acid transporter
MNRYNQEEMPSTKPPSTKGWFWIPLRILLVSFLLSLLSFAVCLLLGILGLAISARLRGVHPDMALAYRHFAFPAAAVIGGIALIVVTTMEFRHYRNRAGVSPEPWR